MKIPFSTLGLPIPLDELTAINNQDYCELCTSNGDISYLLSMLNDGHELTDESQAKVATHLQSVGMTLDEALAFNILSESTEYIKDFLQNGNTKESVDKILKELHDTLKSCDTHHKNIRKILDVITGLDYDKPLYQLYQKAFDGVTYRVEDSAAKTSVFAAIRNIRLCYHMEEICNNIFSVLKRSATEHPLILYRAEKKYPKGDFVHRPNFISASKSLDASFAKYEDKYHVIYTLYVPIGVNCVDISSLSNYSLEEEVVLAGCDIYILHREDVDGKTMVYGLVQNTKTL